MLQSSFIGGLSGWSGPHVRCALIRQFSHAISIYQTTAEARVATDPFIIADNDHYLHCLHYDHPRATLALNDKPGALELARRFNEIVEASEPAAPPTTLGL